LNHTLLVIGTFALFIVLWGLVALFCALLVASEPPSPWDNEPPPTPAITVSDEEEAPKEAQ